MKIDICSDLHIGNQSIDWFTVKNSDSKAIVVAGDTSNSIFKTISILNKMSECYDYVISVMGNHEFYDFSRPEFVDLLLPLLNSNVFILKDGKPVILNDNGRNIAFVGDTGWYDWQCYVDRGITKEQAFNSWNLYSNDSKYIDFKSFPDELSLDQSIKIQNSVLDLSENPDIDSMVIVTHTVPNRTISKWKSKDDLWNKLTPSYVNTNMENIHENDPENKIKAFIYGHTHERSDLIINGIRYINNSVGYGHEAINWQMKEIEV